jgi:hypothetical protein
MSSPHCPFDIIQQVELCFDMGRLGAIAEGGLYYKRLAGIVITLNDMSEQLKLLGSHDSEAVVPSVSYSICPEDPACSCSTAI